jgi:hypothetical protein
LETYPELASCPQGLCSGGNVGMTASVKCKKFYIGQTDF